MSIQNQTVCKLLRTIIKSQEELQAIRQLLNEEISFTFESTYSSIAADTKILNLYSLRRFAQVHEDRDVGIERMIKFYSHGKLQLGMNQWKSMLLSREDRLLAKLANERQIISQEPPQYLMNYCKKVILKEAHLHAEIACMKLGNINEGVLEQICKKVLDDYQEDQIYILRRYLKQVSILQNEFPFEALKKIITRSNTKEIGDYLQQKQKQFMQKQNKKCLNSDPLVHKQLRKLAEKQESGKFLFRQAKSIQNHIDRNNTHFSSRMIQKIEAYTSHLEKQLIIFFKHLRKIMRLNQRIVESKLQLITRHQTNFSLFFKEISKNSQIIPSQLQHYLRTLKVSVPLQSIFLLFKRYCDPISGKLSKKQFNGIFKLATTPPFRKGLKINPLFRETAALCILNEINIETKIQQQKKKLMQKVNLRQIFDAIDIENHRKISQTDLKVTCKKISGKNLKVEEVDELWWRMKADSDEFIDYDTFMYQLIPRTKCIFLH